MVAATNPLRPLLNSIVRTWLLVVMAGSTGCHEKLGLGTPAERVKVTELNIEGVQAVDEERLRAALETSESSWLPWGDDEYFRRAVFDADLRRIEAFYQDHGYPRARVVETDVDLASSGDEVSLRIVVEEGEPTIVAELAYSGFTVLPDDDVEALRANAPLAAGKPVSRPAILQTADAAAAALHDAGYAYAKVDVSTTDVAPNRIRVDVHAEPGTLAYFGSIEIAGNASVSDSVIRRYLSYRPGERFRRSLVQESQRRLYTLGLFEFANVEVVDPDPTIAEVRTRITVAERDHRQVEFSAGYGSEEKLRGEAEWRHVNFFGGARTATVHGKWSWLDRGMESSFLQPYLFRPDLSLTIRAHGWYVDEPAYRALTRGGRVSIAYTPNPRFQATTSVVRELESSRISNDALTDPELRDDLIALGLNPTTGEQDGTLTAVMLDASRQTSTNLLDPSNGYLASAHLEQAGGWLPGTFNYVNTVLEGRHYLTIGDVTFAQRARYGAIAPLDVPSDVPFFKRYFLGGSNSLRGWGRFEVSPLSGFGLPIGGHTMFEASAEARVPVNSKFGLVGFVDAGQVWQEAWEFHAGNLLYDAGAGVRYFTPVGPLRLDVAYQLTPLEGLRVDGKLQERRWRVHFSIGQAF